jgi:hypothetical protein
MPNPVPRFCARFPAALVVFLLLAGPARASDFQAYVNATGALPVHPAEFGEFWDPGWGAGAGFGIPVGSQWELATFFQYMRHGADGERQANDLLLTGPGGVVSEVARLDGRELTIVSVLAEARLLFPSATPTRTWFLGFGFGAAEVSTADALVTPTNPQLQAVTVDGQTDTEFATSLSGGLQLDISPAVRLTVESTYTTIFTDGSSTQFLPLRLGLAFRLR